MDTYSNTSSSQYTDNGFTSPIDDPNDGTPDLPGNAPWNFGTAHHFGTYTGPVDSPITLTGVSPADFSTVI